MYKKLLFTFILLALMLGASAYAQNDDMPPIVVDVTGPIESIDADAQTMVVSGITVDISSTMIPFGMDLAEGEIITVSGIVQDDGSLVADVIVEPEPADLPDNGDDDDDDDNDDDDRSDKPHPVLEAYSEAFDVPYEKLESLANNGFGMGDIARAYLLSDLTGDSVSDILAMAQSEGWGQVLKQYPDISPSQLAPGSVISNGKGNNGRGNSDNNGRGNSDDDDDDDNGNGRGNNGRGNSNNDDDNDDNNGRGNNSRNNCDDDDDDNNGRGNSGRNNCDDDDDDNGNNGRGNNGRDRGNNK